MAKKASKMTSRAELFAKVAEKTKGETLSSREQISYFVDTGSLALNFICSGKFIKGGIPGGRITELYGPSSSGKSLIASNILFGCQKLGGVACILDCENATNAEFMEKTSRLNIDEVVRYTPMSLEQAFRKVLTATKDIREVFGKECPIVWVYDSISVSPCERELKETDLPENYTAAQWKKIVGRKEQPGERAKVCSAEFRKIQPMLEKENITLVFINQTRMKIGVMYGNPETVGGGGNALPFYASLRLRTSTKKKIENKKKKSFAGVNMKIENKKNRTFRPFVETEGVQFFFDNGINPITGLLSILINAGRVESGGKGTFNVHKDFLPEGKDNYSFKGSMERNDIPLSVLTDCPKLIDAATAEEVLEYVEPYKAAMADSASEEFEEKTLGYDAEGNPVDSEDEETNEMEE